MNKSSETLETCRHLYMPALKEPDRLAIGIFLVEKEDELLSVLSEVTNKTVGVTIEFMYNKYIHDMSSHENR